jgi:hypothetical protein
MQKFVVTVRKAYGNTYQETIEASEWEVVGGALLLYTRLGPKHLVKAYGPSGWVSFVIAD